MVLKQLGLEKTEWRKLLDACGQAVRCATAIGNSRAGGPLTMSGGRKGIGGGGRPGGFGPVVDGTIMPHHPFDPEAPAISKDKPLMVGDNRDETAFFFMQSHNTEVFNLTDSGRQERLQKEFPSFAFNRGVQSRILSPVSMSASLPLVTLTSPECPG